MSELEKMFDVLAAKKEARITAVKVSLSILKRKRDELQGELAKNYTELKKCREAIDQGERLLKALLR